MKKMVKLVGIIAFIAVIGFSMAACSNGTTSGNKGDETEHPKSRMDNQPVQNLSWGGKVTVKSADKYLDADWAVDVAKVVNLIETRYSGNSYLQDDIALTFVSSRNTEVILVFNLNNIYEVRSNEYQRVYFKTSALDTMTPIEAESAFMAMLYEYEDSM